MRYASLTVVNWSSHYKRTDSTHLKYPIGTTFDFEIEKFKTFLADKIGLKVGLKTANKLKETLIETGVITHTVTDETGGIQLQHFILLDKTI